MRIASLLLTLLLGASCAHGPRALTLSALGRQHVRAAYRYPFEGSAIMLPILDCADTAHDVQLNIEARGYATIYFSADLWKQLDLPDPPEDGRIPESERLCKELSDNRDSDTNVDVATPGMRELLRDFFVRHSGKRWLVVAARTFRLGPRVAGPGGRASELEGQLVETDHIEVSLYVFTPAGDVAYRADIDCSAHGTDTQHDCGPQFAQAPARLAELLEGFPREIMAQAAIIKVPGAEEKKPAQPAVSAEVAAARIDVEAQLRPDPPAAAALHGKAGKKKGAKVKTKKARKRKGR